MIDSHFKKRKEQLRKITDAHYYAVPRKMSGRKSLIVVEMHSSAGPSHGISERSRKILFADMQDLLDALDQKKKYDGDSGTIFIFPKTAFRFKGGFSLPIAFGMDKNLADRIGTAELRGIQLGFETSPIGLESAMLSVSSKRNWLGIQTGFYSSSLAGLVAQTFVQAKKIGSLFVEGETN
jgi:hypothetical protein